MTSRVPRKVACPCLVGSTIAVTVLHNGLRASQLASPGSPSTESHINVKLAKACAASAAKETSR